MQSVASVDQSAHWSIGRSIDAGGLPNPRSLPTRRTLTVLDTHRQRHTHTQTAQAPAAVASSRRATSALAMSAAVDDPRIKVRVCGRHVCVFRIGEGLGGRAGVCGSDGPGVSVP